jgi:hypothetical protein
MSFANSIWSSSEVFSGNSITCTKYFGNTASVVNYLYEDELEYVHAIKAF